MPSLGSSAEDVPSSSPFLPLIASFCCLDLLSCCLLTTKAARVAILLASLGNFTRLCSQHVLTNMSTITGVCALPLPSHLFCLICWFFMHTSLNGRSLLLTCGDTVAHLRQWVILFADFCDTAADLTPWVIPFADPVAYLTQCVVTFAELW